eukprot:9364319-Pyramimonas_sp.AAC.1
MHVQGTQGWSSSCPQHRCISEPPQNSRGFHDILNSLVAATATTTTTAYCAAPSTLYSPSSIRSCATFLMFGPRGGAPGLRTVRGFDMMASISSKQIGRNSGT